jgi:hypothetical protein
MFSIVVMVEIIAQNCQFALYDCEIVKFIYYFTYL